MHSTLRSPLRPLLAVATLALAIALGTLPAPAHAFWGALAKAGKAGSSVGKAAGTVGKGAAVGVAGAEGAAEVAGRGAAAHAGGLADDAARTGYKATGSEVSLVNAALPPEVAAYLAKPVKDLTPRDTAGMMSSYQKMVERAGRTGDFTAIERASGRSAGPARTLETQVADTRTAPKTAASTPDTPSWLPIEALRLLAHAASASHRSAQKELDQACTPGTPAARRFDAPTRASPTFAKLCARRRA